MNVEKARTIFLSQILETIGHQAVKQKGADVWFHSPLHEDKTPSFHINTAKNIWYDFGTGKGGSVIEFVCEYLKSHGEDYTVADALRWLRNMFSLGTPVFKKREEEELQEPALTVVSISEIENSGLIEYLASRGIELDLAKMYLRELRIHNANSGRYFRVLGFLNDSDGYELRNPAFKGSVAPKDITFIRGIKSLHNHVHLFEGFMDYLSALSDRKIYRFDGDVIILNSVTLLDRAIPYIQDYSYKTVHAWFDNNNAGLIATEALEAFAKKAGLAVSRMNAVYAPHDDVNAWHRYKRGL